MRPTSITPPARPHAGRPTGRSRRAFTLIELVVVLTLIAILSAAILPEMRGSMEETLLRSSARDLIAACQSANARAVATGRAHQLVLDSATHRYRIEPTHSASQPRSGPGRTDTPESGKLDSRIRVELHRIEPPTPDAPDGLEFRPDGTVTAGDIVLRDRSGFSLVIHLNPITARPAVREVARKLDDNR